MKRVRRDNEHILKEGPLKVSVKIRNGHAAYIYVKLKDELKKFMPFPAEELINLSLGDKGEVLSNTTKPELYFRIKVYRTNQLKKTLLDITIHDGEDVQILELSDSFKNDDGSFHESIKYEIYYDLEEELEQVVE